MPVEQQWQIGKWNISRLGGERDIYIYTYFTRTRDRRKQWKFSYVLISSNTLPLLRGIFRIVLFSQDGRIYIKFSLGLENREVVRNIVKIISRATRLEGRKGKKEKERKRTRVYPYYSRRIRRWKKTKQTGRTPGANNYSDIDKNEFIGLTGSYRGRENNRAWKDSIFEINGGNAAVEWQMERAGQRVQIRVPGSLFAPATP